MADADHSPLLLLVTGATGKVGTNFIAHLLAAPAAAAHAAAGDVAVLCDAAGVPLKRSFLHVDDLSAAICAALDNPRVRGEVINIAMDEPVDYGSVARALVEGGRAKGAAVKVATAYHSVGTTPRLSCCSATAGGHASMHALSLSARGTLCEPRAINV